MSASGGLTGDPFLTTAEVAELFRVDPKTVTRWALAGDLVGQRTPGGRAWRFRRSAVRAAMTDSTVKRKTEGGGNVAE